MKSSVEISEVVPRTVREEVLELLWSERHWPGSSREDYHRLWAWRFGSLGDGDSPAWIARSGDGRVVGHVAVFPRRFRLGDTVIRCAVPGDLIVHPEWRPHGIGARLILLPKMLVRRGRFDMILVMGNEISYRLCLRLGYHDLGALHRYVDVKRVAPRLGRRFARVGAAGAAGRVLDGLLAGRRQLYRWKMGQNAAGLEVRMLNARAVLRLDRSHWIHPAGRLVSAEGEDYLARRFLEDPFTSRRVFGLFDRSTGRIEGHVIVERRGANAVVCDCRVNVGRMNDAAAIALAGEHLSREVETYAVPALPASKLARDLGAAGYLHRQTADAEAGRIHVSAFWDADNRRLEPLEGGESWNLYSGAADA